ncbi:MAG: AAA family ATPase [Solirubrobacteraceae bacterium]
MYVLLAGPPGSGKSTLAPPLAAEFGLSFLAKDDIKALMEIFGRPETVEASRKLGRAAVVALLTAGIDRRGGPADARNDP